MTDAPVPVVETPAVDAVADAEATSGVRRAGSAGLALPRVIGEAGPTAVGKFVEFFRGADRERADAGGVRAGGGAVSGVARGPRPPDRGGLAAPRRRLHPDAPRVGADREAARGRGPHALRLARRQARSSRRTPRLRSGGRSTSSRRARRRSLSPAEARKLLESIDTGALARLRDRALLSVMLYSFARVSAVLGMRRQDYFG